MKTLKSAIVAAALLGVFATAETANANHGGGGGLTTCHTVWTNDHFVALRTGPGTGYHRIRKLWYQSTVKTNWVTHGSWLKVRHNGTWGWAHHSLINC